MTLKPKTINYRQIELEPAAGDDLQALPRNGSLLRVRASLWH